MGEVEKLNVFDNERLGNGEWVFSGEIAKHFDEHVSKSVPLYEQGHSLICDISDFFVRNDSVVYEIGCSTGTLLRDLANKHSSKDAKFIGIDVIEDMIHEAKRKCIDMRNIELIHSDILDFEFQKTDLIISYYTMQFIPPKYRQDIINKVYNSLNWGGAYIFFEKMRAPDARFQDITVQLYQEYKLKNGFSSDEIIGKMRSLKGVLEPFSMIGNIGLLERAGFVDYTPIMSYLGFTGVLCIK